MRESIPLEIPARSATSCALIFFSSLHLNRDANRDRFFEGFSVTRFVLAGILPLLCVGGGFYYYDSRKNSAVSYQYENEEDLHGEPRIAISTIHQAKGGEAENVAVYLDLSKAQKRTSMLQPDGLHRQFYVAITRTIDNLYLIQAQDDYYRYVI